MNGRIDVEILPMMKDFAGQVRGQVKEAITPAAATAESELNHMDQRVTQSVAHTEREHEGMFTRMKDQVKDLAKFMIPTLGLVEGVKFLKESIEAGREEQKQLAQTQAVLKSTGEVAGVTAEHVKDLAEEQSAHTGIISDQIRANENLLLTFTAVHNQVGKGNDIFDQATKAVLDMSTALKEDGKAATIQLGKALQDPILGMTALRRVGVAFTKDQQDMVKGWVEHGHALRAQKFILREINKEFGGSAEAQATAGDKLHAVWHNVQVEIGSHILPMLDKLESFVAEKVIPAVEEMFHGWAEGTGAGGKLHALFSSLLAIIKPLISEGIGLLSGAWNVLVQVLTTYVIPAFEAIGGFIETHKTLVRTLIVAIVAFWAAWKGYKIIMAVRDAMIALNVVMEANPIGVVIAAVAALVAAFVYAYTHSKTFRDIIHNVFTDIKNWAQDVFNFLKKWGPLILTVLLPVIGLPLLIWQHWKQIIGFLKRVWNDVYGFLKKWGPLALAVLVPFIGIPLLIWQHFKQIKDFITNAWDDAYAAVKAGVTAVLDFLGTLGGKIKDIFSNALHWLVDAGKAVLNGLLAGVKWLWEHSVVGWLMDRKDAIVGFFSRAGKWLFNAGKSIITGLVDGLKHMFDNVVNWFKDLPGHILGALGIHSPPGWAIRAGEWIIKAVLTGLKNLGPAALHWVENWAGSIMSSIAGAVSGPAGGISLLPGAAGTSAAAMQEAAKHLVPASWNNAAEFGALIKLWNQESGWRWNATNPSSGAYGIPQALPASKMAEAGSDWRTNPITQMRWGINYIFNRYGDPLGAWAHEQAFNWYDKGKWEILADELAVIHKGEMVVPADLASTIRRLAGRDPRHGTSKDPLSREDRQFNRAISLSRDLASAWHEAVNNVNSFTRSLSQGVGTVRDSFFTLLRAARQSGFDHSKLVQLRTEQQRLVSLVGDHERAVNRVNAATQRLADLQSKVKDIVNSTRQSVMGTFDITTAGTGGTTSQGLPAALTVRSVIGSLSSSVSQMRAFSRGIRKLVREGLPMAWVNALFQQGPGAMPMINELASATPAQLRQLRSGYSDLSNIGTDLGKFLGRDRYGGAINDQKQRLREDRRDEQHFNRMMHAQETHMAHAFAKALAGMAIEFDGDGLARLVTRHQSVHAQKGRHH